MKDQTIIVLCAILMLAALESIALMKGINGTLFSAIIAVIAGLAGWTMPQLKIMKGGAKNG